MDVRDLMRHLHYSIHSERVDVLGCAVYFPHALTRKYPNAETD